MNILSMLDSLVLCSMFCSSLQKADMDFSPVAFQPDTVANGPYVNLYPHSYDCLALLVPISKVRQPLLLSFLQKPSTAPMLVVLAVLLVYRALRRLEPLGVAAMLTFGAFLAQLNVPAARRASDAMWTLSVLLSAIFAAIIMSGTMFESLVNVKYVPEIDTFEQLIASGLGIYAKNTGLDDHYVFSRCVLWPCFICYAIYA